MTNGLGTIGVRGLAERKGRTALTAAGITLGVALFVGALIAASTTNQGLEGLRAESAGQADVLVTPAGGVGTNLMDPLVTEGLSSTHEARLRELPGVVAAGSVVAFPTVITTEDGRSTLLAVNRRSSQASLIGVDVEGQGVFPMSVQDGRLPRPGAAEVVVPLSFAQDFALGVGERISVSSPAGDRSLGVVGILEAEGVGRLRMGVFTSIETARTLAGRPKDAASLIGLRLAPGEDVHAWIDANTDAAGSGLALAPATEGADRFAEQLTFFSGTMTVMAAAVLFSAGFLIYLTLSMSVVERTRLYGTMHALGATRAQVRRVVLLEAFGMGAVATVIGVGLGVLVAMALNAGTARFLILVGSPPVHVPWWAIAAGVVFGLATTVISALLPARRASRMDAVTAMRDTPSDTPPRPSGWVAGVALLGAGAGALSVSSSLVVQVVALLALLAGAVRLIGNLIRPLAGLVRGLASRASRGTGEVAVMHLAKEPTRSAYTLALVMVVMALTFATGALTMSFVRSLEREIDRTFTNDISLYAASTFDEEFLDAVDSHPVVAAASPISWARTHVLGGGQRDFVFVDVIDPDTYFDVSGFLWVDGNEATAREALQRGHAVILPSAMGHRLGVGVGDRVMLETSEGPTAFEVAGLVRLSNIPPRIATGQAAGRELFGVDQPVSVRLNVVPGVDVDDAAAAIERDLGGSTTFIVSTPDVLRADMRAQVLGVSNGFFVLLLLAGIVGLFGLANTLAVSVTQRVREIGVLRAIGARRGQVRGMVLVESTTLILVAFALAVPLGALISRPLMDAASATIGDLDVPFVFPWSMVGIVALTGLLIGGVAALWPARRAAATEIDTALRFE